MTVHMQMRKFPHETVISLYNILMQSSKRIVAGIDEAGRGPLAGPVVAAALTILPQSRLGKLRDSKQLSFKQREEHYRLFLLNPNIQWGIGRVSERVIDRINIYEATKLAMERAVRNLLKKVPLDFLYIDGITRIQTNIAQQTVVRGDEQIPLCAAASIVAKVTRDRLMLRYHKIYPEYGFDQHKGYGTKHHFQMLKKCGPCKIHRMSFSPSR